MSMRERATVTAVLGPTNTGKTHYAIERMLAYPSGVIGLPLRLLAREVYERIKALRGPSVVALVTGEERVVPDRVAYWVATVEAMPLENGADFLAVDEIQLAADPERGHVFTDRLLHARGLKETLFLGADTMWGAIAAVEPKARFMRRERFSDLAYIGAKKLSRMPARSATVGFSVEGVYATAELLRRQKGGTAVVMGALSPRTRNAQVELYQNGDVDHLVATDAIGMGLNLDIRHVAFSSLAKFDGRRMRPLAPNELAQIAGRAGRHTEAGTFGVTGEAPELDRGVAEAIVAHRFAPIRKLQWRNSELDFAGIGRLIASLERGTDHEWLARGREADDLSALKALADQPAIRDRVTTARDVRLLWDVCRIPDFRGISATEHAGLLETIFGFLQGGGQVPDDWFARQVGRIDRTGGDIDTISKRLAYVRTWTYVAQRPGWTRDEAHWREATRAVEDRLSDALHARLTQRFVDRRTSVLMRRMRRREGLLAEVNDKGEVTVEGEHVGRLDGFRFHQAADAAPEEGRTLRAAGKGGLGPEYHLRADRFYNASDTQIDITEQGGLMWGEAAVGRLAPGPDVLRPEVVAFVDDEAGGDVAEKVRRRLQHYVDRRIAALFEPLLAMSRDETLTGLARGFAFRLIESLGVLPREPVAREVRELDQTARGKLRKHGVKFGQFTIFLPALLKPAPTRLRLVLWSLAAGHEVFPESPPPGLVTIPATADGPDGYYAMSGYRAAGSRAIRLDMLERLADMIRAEDTRAGFEARADMLSITGLGLEQFAELMQGLGYRAERGERAKVRPPAPAGGTASGAEADGAPVPEAGAEVQPGAGGEPAPPGDSTAPAPGIEETAAPAHVAEEASAPAPDGEVAAGNGPEDPTPPRADADADAAAAEAGAPPEQGAHAAAMPEWDAGVPAAAGSDPAAEAVGAAGESARAETEVFYTFTRAPRRKAEGGGEAPAGRRKRKHGGGKSAAKDAAPGKPAKKGAKSDKPREESGKKDRIDPDNPFAAALMGLKDKR